jgi:putative dimethyl sulfoxide reductase chaperone
MEYPMKEQMAAMRKDKERSYAEEAKLRSQVYRFLSTAFAKEPTAQLLTRLHSKSLSNLEDELGLDLPEVERVEPIEDQVEKLACEHARLFIGPGQHLSPHESVWRGEGRLWGEATAEVDSIYRDCGFSVDPSFKDLPDHVSVELAFIARACDVEADRWVAQDQELLKNVLTIETQFMDWHLLKWVPTFLDQVAENSQCIYYKRLGRVAKRFLMQDRMYFSARMEHC